MDPAYEITALVVKVERELKRRPVFLFEKVKGPRFPVLTNLHASPARPPGRSSSHDCSPEDDHELEVAASGGRPRGDTRRRLQLPSPGRVHGPGTARAARADSDDPRHLQPRVHEKTRRPLPPTTAPDPPDPGAPEPRCGRLLPGPQHDPPRCRPPHELHRGRDRALSPPARHPTRQHRAGRAELWGLGLAPGRGLLLSADRRRRGVRTDVSWPAPALDADAHAPAPGIRATRAAGQVPRSYLPLRGRLILRCRRLGRIRQGVRLAGRRGPYRASGPRRRLPGVRALHARQPWRRLGPTVRRRVLRERGAAARRARARAHSSSGGPPLKRTPTSRARPSAGFAGANESWGRVWRGAQRSAPPTLTRPLTAS